MGSLLLLYENFLDEVGVTFSGGSWALPLSNLRDPRPSRKARSSSTDTDDSKLRVDLLASRSLKSIAITHSNLSEDAQYRITWYSDEFVASAGNTGWLPVPGYPADDPDDKGVSIFHIFAAVTSSRYWEIEFDDQSNVDGYVQFGRLVMPNHWAPPHNFGLNNSEGAEPNTVRQNSLGGVGYFNRRKPARFFNFAFDFLPADEIPTLRRIRKLCNTDRQVVVIPDPEDTDNLNDTAFLATLRDMPALQLLALGDASIAFQAIEVIG